MPNSFYNDGSGWICRQCEIETKGPEADSAFPSRMFKEGEAESSSPALASLARAKWADAARTTLTCPRCGLTEKIDVA